MVGLMKIIFWTILEDVNKQSGSLWECINDETSFQNCKNMLKTKRWFAFDYAQLKHVCIFWVFDSSNNFEVEKAKYRDRLHIRSGCNLLYTTQPTVIKIQFTVKRHSLQERWDWP